MGGLLLHPTPSDYSTKGSRPIRGLLYLICHAVAEAKLYHVSDVIRAAWIPLLVFVLGGAGVVVMAVIDPKLKYCQIPLMVNMVVVLATFGWIAFVAMTHTSGKAIELCPHCQRKVIYDKSQMGLTVLCPACGQPWMAGEDDTRWGSGSDA